MENFVNYRAYRICLRTLCTNKQKIPDASISASLHTTLYFAHHHDREIYPSEEIHPYQLVLAEEIDSLPEPLLIKFLIHFGLVFNYELTFKM